MLRNAAVLIISAMTVFIQPTFSVYAPSDILSTGKFSIAGQTTPLFQHGENEVSSVNEASSENAEKSAAVQKEASAYKPEYGKISYAHLRYIANDIGARLAGTDGEHTAKKYMRSAFENLGYEPYEQEFAFLAGGVEKYSSNVIAVKKGESNKTIIIGAHYDSVDTASGADDNASGIAVLLEAAELLRTVKTEYTIEFIAFGAEEYGWWGSKHYVQQMSDVERSNALVMINLDSLVSGDFMYIYGSEGEAGWVRDKALKLAGQMGISLWTSPGTNEKYPAGTTGDWSDHVPFKRSGIPYAYFEATNWETGDLDGYTQTVRDGKIYHTWKDNLSYLEENYPGRVQERLEAFSHVLAELIVHFQSKLN